MEQVILGIDIGSSKTCSIIAEIKSGSPYIIGTGMQTSKGIRKGAITNIEQASRAIRESVNQAKRIAGVDISQAYISLSGVYTKSIDSIGVINNPRDDIGIQEINRVMQAALYNANIPKNYEVVHVLPYLFKVDDRDYIDDPFGMSGTRIEVSVHIVIAQKSGLENLKKAVKNAGIEISGIVLSAYASSIAVLNNDEKELGAACIDMGASSCDIMIHYGNSMRYDDFLGVGSGHITNDIVMALTIPPLVADTIKIKYATLNELTQEERGSYLEIPSNTSPTEARKVELEVLHSVVFSRALETMQIIEHSLEKSGLKNNLGAGIVITGGMAHMNGLKELAKGIFPNLPIRIATPREINDSFSMLKDPIYATVAGLILYGAGKWTNYEIDSTKKLKHTQNNNILTNTSLSDIEVKENDLSDLQMAKNAEDAIKLGRKNDKNENGVVDKIVNFFKSLF
ncbi:MAG: cell division protein FtsA [Helicobacteraceae bacterium]|nr:cell division protein FtsA [Helicobacteraceae bacterium]